MNNARIDRLTTSTSLSYVLYGLGAILDFPAAVYAACVLQPLVLWFAIAVLAKGRPYAGKEGRRTLLWGIYGLLFSGILLFLAAIYLRS